MLCKRKEICAPQYSLNYWLMCNNFWFSIFNDRWISVDIDSGGEKKNRNWWIKTIWAIRRGMSNNTSMSHKEFNWNILTIICMTHIKYVIRTHGPLWLVRYAISSSEMWWNIAVFKSSSTIYTRFVSWYTCISCQRRKKNRRSI